MLLLVATTWVVKTSKTITKYNKFKLKLKSMCKQ